MMIVIPARCLSHSNFQLPTNCYFWQLMWHQLSELWLNLMLGAELWPLQIFRRSKSADALGWPLTHSLASNRTTRELHSACLRAIEKCSMAPITCSMAHKTWYIVHRTFFLDKRTRSMHQDIMIYGTQSIFMDHETCSINHRTCALVQRPYYIVLRTCPRDRTTWSMVHPIIHSIIRLIACSIVRVIACLFACSVARSIAQSTTW